MKKIEVRANESKHELKNATFKFCITLSILETKAETTKLDLTNVFKEMKSINLWVIKVKTKAIILQNKLKVNGEANKSRFYERNGKTPLMVLEEKKSNPCKGWCENENMHHW